MTGLSQPTQLTQLTQLAASPCVLKKKMERVPAEPRPRAP